jgi:hypothetical protein
MRVFFSTIVRGAPAEQAGELVRLDWDTKTVEKRVPIFPTNPSFEHDPNPRGGTRGARGVEFMGDEVIVASYHTLKVFDRQLGHRRDITHPLMADIHEIRASGENRLWVTSTRIDAAFEVDLESGLLTREFWPREMPGFQKALGLTPLEIDKQADNRGRFLERKYLEHPGHLHLNTVAEWQDEVYGLFYSFAAIANLDRDEVALHDPALKGGHNLIILEDGTTFVNDTLGHRVRVYDLRTKRLIKVINLSDFPWVKDVVKYNIATSSRFARALIRRRRISRYVKWLIDRFKMRRFVNAWPLFIRGLDMVGDHLFIGLSPASILRVDWRRGDLVDAFNYAKDAEATIHGVRVLTED